MSQNKNLSTEQTKAEPLRDWDASYKRGKEALPWDTGAPAPELVQYLQSRDMPARVLEVGCGTGSNAIWMAERVANVVATEISETAIELAKNKMASHQSLNLVFKLAEITQPNSIDAASMDFVFDRGVYHVMPNQNSRRSFIESVASALKTGGFWLCIAGSADEIRSEGQGGPPQLQASDLVNLAEKHFEVFHLKRILSRTILSRNRYVGSAVPQAVSFCAFVDFLDRGCSSVKSHPRHT